MPGNMSLWIDHTHDGQYCCYGLWIPAEHHHMKPYCWELVTNQHPEAINMVSLPHQRHLNDSSDDLSSPSVSRLDISVVLTPASPNIGKLGPRDETMRRKRRTEGLGGMVDLSVQGASWRESPPGRTVRRTASAIALKDGSVARHLRGNFSNEWHWARVWLQFGLHLEIISH